MPASNQLATYRSCFGALLEHEKVRPSPNRDRCSTSFPCFQRWVDAPPAGWTARYAGSRLYRRVLGYTDRAFPDPRCYRPIRESEPGGQAQGRPGSEAGSGWQVRGPQVTHRYEPRAGGAGEAATPSQSHDRRAEIAALDSGRTSQPWACECQWPSICGAVDPGNDPAAVRALCLTQDASTGSTGSDVTIRQH